MKIVISKCVTVGENNVAEVNALMAEGFAVQFLPVAEKATPKAVRIRRKRRRAPNVEGNQLKAMVELRKKGLTHRIIARRFGMSVSGSANAIRKAEKAGAR